MTIPWCESNKKIGLYFGMWHCWVFFVFDNKNWFKCAILFCLIGIDDNYNYNIDLKRQLFTSIQVQIMNQEDLM